MKIYSRILLLCLLAVSLFGCRDLPDGPETPTRGEIISIEKLRTFSTDQLDSLKATVDPSLVLAIRPTYAVDVYRVIYQTERTEGNYIQASGVIALPVGAEGALPLASYQHGTTSSNEGVPSNNLGGEALIGLNLASDGLAVTIPDYLGLGYSEGHHPYVHAATSAASVIDIIRAARIHCANESIELNGQLVLFGYSQGGYATMAAHKFMEEQYSDEFQITASAPMAGPYDLSGAMVELMLSNEPYGFPAYLPMTLLGYNSIYNLYEKPQSFLKEPYATIIPPMFDGGRFHTWEIEQYLPDVPREMFSEELLADFENNPDHPFREVLKANDLYDWLPIAPMRIYHCTGDEQVPVSNAIKARDTFIANGKTDVEWIDFGNYLHQDCAVYALLDAREWVLGIIE